MSKNMPPRGLSPWEIVKWHGWTEVVRVDHLGPCWEFNGPKMGSGYGSIEPDRRPTLVHRVAYEHYNDTSLPPYIHGSPANVLVRHKCDNKSCLNPKHLEAGSQAQNNKDARDRGQWWTRRGEDHPSSKLTAREVSEIRSAYRGRGRGPTQVELADKYGVTQGLIAAIVGRRVWKEMTEDE